MLEGTLFLVLFVVTRTAEESNISSLMPSGYDVNMYTSITNSYTMKGTVTLVALSNGGDNILLPSSSTHLEAIQGKTPTPTYFVLQTNSWLHFSSSLNPRINITSQINNLPSSISLNHSASHRFDQKPENLTHISDKVYFHSTTVLDTISDLTISTRSSTSMAISEHIVDTTHLVRNSSLQGYLPAASEKPNVSSTQNLYIVSSSSLFYSPLPVTESNTSNSLHYEKSNVGAMFSLATSSHDSNPRMTKSENLTMTGGATSVFTSVIDYAVSTTFTRNLQETIMSSKVETTPSQPLSSQISSVPIRSKYLNATERGTSAMNITYSTVSSDFLSNFQEGMMSSEVEATKSQPLSGRTLTKSSEYLAVTERATLVTPNTVDGTISTASITYLQEGMIFSKVTTILSSPTSSYNSSANVPKTSDYLTLAESAKSISATESAISTAWISNLQESMMHSRVSVTMSEPLSSDVSNTSVPETYEYLTLTGRAKSLPTSAIGSTIQTASTNNLQESVLSSSIPALLSNFNSFITDGIQSSSSVQSSATAHLSTNLFKQSNSESMHRLVLHTGHDNSTAKMPVTRTTSIIHHSVLIDTSSAISIDSHANSSYLQLQTTTGLFEVMTSQHMFTTSNEVLNSTRYSNLSHKFASDTTSKLGKEPSSSPVFILLTSGNVISSEMFNSTQLLLASQLAATISISTTQGITYNQSRSNVSSSSVSQFSTTSLQFTLKITSSYFTMSSSKDPIVPKPSTEIFATAEQMSKQAPESLLTNSLSTQIISVANSTRMGSALLSTVAPSSVTGLATPSSSFISSVSQNSSMYAILFFMEFRVQDSVFTSALTMKMSPEYIQLNNEMTNLIKSAYKTASGFIGVTSMEFRNGSVIVQTTASFTNDSTETSNSLAEKLQNASGMLSINISGISITGLCSAASCSGRGICIETSNDTRCQGCTGGYGGSRCQIAVAVDGQYTPWSLFTACSKSCGGGVQYRRRTCSNPVPLNGGKNCSSSGVAEETRKCNDKACKDVLILAIIVTAVCLIVIVVLVLAYCVRKKHIRRYYKEYGWRNKGQSYSLSAYAIENSRKPPLQGDIVPLEIIYNDPMGGVSNPDFNQDQPYENREEEVYKKHLATFLNQTKKLRAEKPNGTPGVSGHDNLALQPDAEGTEVQNGNVKPQQSGREKNKDHLL